MLGSAVRLDPHAEVGVIEWVLSSLALAPSATSSRPTGWWGPSHRPAIVDPRNDEGRLGVSRAAFHTREIARESAPRVGPPRWGSGYRGPSLWTGCDTSAP